MCKNYFYQALARDGYRCVISRIYDTNSYQQYPEIAQVVTNQDLDVVATQAAHIFLPSTNQGISGDDEGGPKV
jgi:hypothetical protein